MLGNFSKSFLFLSFEDQIQVILLIIKKSLQESFYENQTQQPTKNLYGYGEIQFGFWVHIATP
jgi:hypothetical protein